MLIGDARIDAAVLLVLLALALGVGLVVGWQLRGYHELGRRGHDIDLTGAGR